MMYAVAQPTIIQPAVAKLTFVEDSAAKLGRSEQARLRNGVLIFDSTFV